MTWKDKLEMGLKDDAPYRRDHLPLFQQRNGGPATRPDDPTRSPEEPGAPAGVITLPGQPVSRRRTPRRKEKRSS
jgi:hypothetical protein